MNFGLTIPTLNAGENFSKLLSQLAAQDFICPRRIKFTKEVIAWS